MIHWNKSVWLVKTGHMICNIQSLAVQLRYSAIYPYLFPSMCVASCSKNIVLNNSFY